jgi:Protein of unknown function (DUF4197)
MKKLFTLSLILISITLGSCDVINQAAGAAGAATGISNAEAGSGIKEALAQGIAKSVLQLNTTDGFFKDAIYKVLLPPDAVKIENTLRKLGFNSMVDKAILQINRGAEDAAGYAKPIFVDAIKSMTLNDAIGLIRNGDTSATHFFREKTTDKLMAAFSPVIKSSLDKTEATKYYSEMVTKYNNLPITFKKVNPDLTGYVTERATNALFNLIAKEEVNIRTNLAARTSDLLKKVFGGAYK